MVEFLYSFYLLINIVRLNFPISCFISFPLSLFPVCFPVFTRQIARYPPRKNKKTSSKTILKLKPSKI